MNLKKQTLLYAVSVLSVTPAFAQKTWSLSDCLSYAESNNIQIQQAQQTALSSEEDVKTDKAAFFPSLTFSTGHNWYWTQEGTTIVSGTGANSQITGTKNPTYNGSYNLNMSVTLYDGLSNVNTLKQSRLQHQSDVYSAEKTTNNIRIQIIQAYYQIL